MVRVYSDSIIKGFGPTVFFVNSPDTNKYQVYHEIHSVVLSYTLLLLKGDEMP